MDQGTDEWFRNRRGKVTASRMGDLMAVTAKGAPAAARAAYMVEIVVERLTGSAPERFTSAAMEWGTVQEPAARAAYEFLTDATVELTGFIDHPTIPMLGASPDGLVGDDGLVEFKCPTTATHLGSLLGAEIDRRYVLQIHTQMACTGRAWADFVSFDPRLPPELQTIIRRVPRDEALVAEILRAAEAFLAEADATIGRLAATYKVRPYVAPLAPVSTLPGVEEAARFLFAG